MNTPTWVLISWHERKNLSEQLKKNSFESHLHQGLLRLTRHSLAMLGLACLALVFAFVSQPDWRQSASHNLMNWLDARQDAALEHTSVTNADLVPLHLGTVSGLALTDEQQAVTLWLSRRYKLSPEPLGGLVSEAWALGDRIQVSPTLLLAVMAIESRFNPFASGPQGGMGLMQIEPNAQHSALLPFGGYLAAFDPLTNLRVGAKHLQKLIEQSASIESALHLYATASGQPNGAEYATRVLAKQQQLDTMSRPFKSVEVAQNSRLQTPSATHSRH